MSGFLQDLRYAGRMLFKHPGVSVMAVGALALGIGVTATMFSIVYAALLRGLPFEGGDRIMMVMEANPSHGVNRSSVPLQDYADLSRQQSSFESLAAYYQGTVNVRWSDRPERFDGAFITPGAFAALGVRPALGREFREDEGAPGAPLRVILSWHLWQDRFAGSPDAVGQVLKVNGEAAEIVGVMPEGFLFPERQDIWVSLRTDDLALPRRQGQWVQVYGRLREGVPVDRAATELAGIAQRLAAEYPETNEGVTAIVVPFQETAIGEDARGLLMTMLAVVSLVLVIACTNVANLLLARAAVRIKEVGIRTAMGASRWRVVSQMVAEALALASIGGLVGAGLAWVGIGLFARAVEGTDPPFWMVFRLDGPILLFILAISIAAAFVAGGIPALKASRMDVSAILKDESRGTSSLRIGRLSKVLVVGEIAMSMGLLVAAGLMTKSIATLRNFDFGFDTEQVFTARLGLFESEFPDAAGRRRFYEELTSRLEEIPEATSVSLATALPGTGSGNTQLAIEGEAYTEDRDYPRARVAQVGPRYFATVGSRVTTGRDFTEDDDGNAMPVAIVNESFARRHFTGGSPLGRRFRQGASASTEPWLTVVGVVPDLWMQGVGNAEEQPDGFYVPVAQSDARFMSILARGPADPMSLTGAVRDAVASVHADTPIYFVDTLAGRIAENTWVYNVFGALFMVFGGVALFLASIGLYGVMAFSVSRRTPEVGIRMALGAESGQVLSLILRQGLVQVAVGVVLGLGLAVVVSRALALVLFQVGAGDPGVFAIVAVVLLLTGLAASTIPALRATRVDPLVALRSE
jgi:putative ABC transport system permease protein